MRFSKNDTLCYSDIIYTAHQQHFAAMNIRGVDGGFRRVRKMRREQKKSFCFARRMYKFASRGDLQCWQADAAGLLSRDTRTPIAKGCKALTWNKDTSRSSAALFPNLYRSLAPSVH